MRIAYLGQMADLSTENGISKKIRSQMSAWHGAGHEVRYFALASSAAVWPGLVPLEAEILAHTNPAQRVVRSYAVARRVRAWRPDAIYFRCAYHSPGFTSLFRSIPTVAEINSDDATEYGITLPWLKRTYHRFTRERILRPVRGFVPVTRELAARFARFGRPLEAIGNGIDLRDFPPIPPADPARPPRLVFVGSPGTPWHGLDRVAELARLCPEYEFDIVGCRAAEWELSGGGAPLANVRLHGPLPRERYEPILRAATAAIGTLGLYRKNMHEACPLKVREYLAFGLPVIGGYEDTDVPPDADYFLRLPNNAEPLDPWRERIAAFVERWRTRRVPRAAIAHLDVSVKEGPRLAFMERIVAKSRHG